MSIIPPEQINVGQFGIPGKCESYKLEQRVKNQIDKIVNILEVNYTEVNFAETCEIKEDSDIQTEKFFNTNIPEVNYTEDNLDEICEILEDSFIQPGKYFGTNIALSLFSKLNEFGLNSIKSNNKEIYKPENQVNEKIKDLLALNSLKIKNYLIYFPDLLFNDIYYPETICELCSGIKFLFDFWGDSIYDGKKLKELFDPKGSEISDLNASIENWLEDLDNYKPEITEKFPKEHWWWEKLEKLLTIDTNQHITTAPTGI